jgi:hypothetical protein
MQKPNLFAAQPPNEALPLLPNPENCIELFIPLWQMPRRRFEKQGYSAAPYSLSLKGFFTPSREAWTSPFSWPN